MTIEEFFKKTPKAAVAFSGGVDSSYLLWTGLRCGADLHAFYVKSPFQPQFELDDAIRLTEELGAKLTVLTLDVLDDPVIRSNPPDRCYHCKNRIFGAIRDAAAKAGYTMLLDGTNASDEASDRPGMRALQEMQVLSPLRLCGLTKQEIRERSRAAGLFTWDKPAYACLATRIPTGREITAEDLSLTEESENYLAALGLKDFRIRLRPDGACLQIPASQMELIIQNREDILQTLKPHYGNIYLDLTARTPSV